jgi:hypothetical protein
MPPAAEDRRSLPVVALSQRRHFLSVPVSQGRNQVHRVRCGMEWLPEFISRQVGLAVPCEPRWARDCPLPASAFRKLLLAIGMVRITLLFPNLPFPGGRASTRTQADCSQNRNCTSPMSQLQLGIQNPLKLWCSLRGFLSGYGIWRSVLALFILSSLSALGPHSIHVNSFSKDSMSAWGSV